VARRGNRGGLPPLGDRLTKRIARTKEGVRPSRERHRTVNGSKFRRLDTLDELLEMLYGTLPSGTPPILTDEDEGGVNSCDGPPES